MVIVGSANVRSDVCQDIQRKKADSADLAGIGESRSGRQIKDQNLKGFGRPGKLER
jgi:hypothetical protein